MAIRYITYSNGIPKATLESRAFDETSVIGSTITGGTSITMPASGNYQGDELEIYLNGMRLEDVVDYVWVGSAPRTQIQMTFDLLQGDILRWRKDLN